MNAILEAAQTGATNGIAAVDAALVRFPQDARLHFLKGSMLVGEKRLIAAHTALSKAVELDPQFHIARFQLGFFELTSGEAEAALTTWRPLRDLPKGQYLRSFVEGLENLAADRFTECIAALREGMTQNLENPPLNADMQLIIERCQEVLTSGGETGGEPSGDGAVSSTSFLLGTARRPAR
ncbi:MAG: hypothetical protein ABL926_00390 [Novosphingobium sp.]|uniref:hypothetical protein n=1 Tax=Novosphingobium sp. TaxID=1874826 RepID=UPI0032B82599